MGLTKEELLFLSDSIDRDFHPIEDQDKADAILDRLSRETFDLTIQELREST